MILTYISLKVACCTVLSCNYVNHEIRRFIKRLPLCSSHCEYHTKISVIKMMVKNATQLFCHPSLLFITQYNNVQNHLW